MTTVHHVESPEAFKAALAEHEFVIVDYFATWCGPCKVIAPFFEKYSKEDKYETVHFLKFDVDQLSKLADELKIEAMPTFQMFKHGEKIGHVVEPKPDELASFIDKGMSQ